MFAFGRAVELVNDVSKVSLANHTPAKGGVADISAVQGCNLIPDFAEAVRKVLAQPIFKNSGYGSVQAYNGHAHGLRTMLSPQVSVL